MLKEKIKEYLLRTQRYTGTDNIYLAKFGSIIFSGNILSGVLSFLISLAFAHFMAKDAYGSYRLVVAAIGTVSIFSLPGLATALQKAAARGQEGFFRQAVKTKLRWSVLSSLALMIVAGYYRFNGNLTTPLLISFLLAAAAFPFFEASKLYNAYLAGKKLFTESTFYGITSQAAYSGLLALVLWLKPTLIPVMTVFILGNTAINWFFHFRSLKKFPPNKENDPTGLPYAKKLTLLGAVPTIAKYIDSFLSFSLLGPAALATYAFTTLPTDKLGLFTNPILTLAFPKFAQRSREELRQSIYKKWLLMLLITGVMTGLFILFLPFLYRLLLPKYLEAIPYARWYALSFLTSPNGIILTAFESQGMVKELTKIQLFSSGVQIALMTALVFPFGLWGLVAANIITVGLKSAVFLRLARNI